MTFKPDTDAPARLLSAAIAGAMALAAGAGLLVDGLYRDIAWIRLVWLANDLVTLFVAVPLLVLGVRSRR